MSDELTPEPVPTTPGYVLETTPPPTISLQDILNAVEVSQTREAEDKVKLEAIGTISFETLRASLVQWAVRGFPNAYVVHEVSVASPSVCSDGVVRNLTDYVSFCSGKTITEHVAVLQERFTDIVVSFAYSGSAILIVVSKQQA